jgi:hypothetical protein
VGGRKDRKMRKWEDGREDDTDEGRWTMDDGGQKIRSSEAEKVRGRMTDGGRGTMDEGRWTREVGDQGSAIADKIC